MRERSAVLGLVSGLAVVVLTLIAVAVVNLPEASGAAPAARVKANRCGMADAAQDQGYGIARTVNQQVCATLPDN